MQVDGSACAWTCILIAGSAAVPAGIAFVWAFGESLAEAIIQTTFE